MDRRFQPGHAVAVGLALLVVNFVALPSASSSRDVVTARALAGMVLPEAPSSGARTACEAWTGRSADEVECRFGVAIGHSELGAPPGPPAADRVVEPRAREAAAREQARTSILEKLAAYRALRDALATSAGPVVLGAIDARIERALEASAEPSSIAWPRLFDALLTLGGERYDARTGRFVRVSWDVARLIDGREGAIARAERLEAALWLALYAVPVAAAVAVAVAHARAGMAAAAVAMAVIALLDLGLLITADAAVRFGAQSPGFALNPFHGLLERQVLIAGFGLLAFCLLLVFRRPLGGFLQWLSGRPRVMSLFGCSGVVSAYVLLGPAAGSEALKVGVSLFAAMVATRHARETWLVRRHLPGGLSLQVLSHALRWGRDAQHDAGVYVVRALLGRFVALFVIITCTVGAAALVFSDLGGALIATAVLMALVLIVFGPIPFLGAAGGCAVVAALLAQTEKVRERVRLMLDPMEASVSDFARLIKFEQSAQPFGYGLGEIRWCNHDGVCLPLQVLSDYMPMLLSGVLGRWVAFGLFVAMVAAGFFGAMRGLVVLAAGSPSRRLASSFALFLFIALLAQTTMTFLGNWRVVPLTGLGMPLLSIGLSSTLAAVLAAAALCGACTGSEPVAGS